MNDFTLLQDPDFSQFVEVDPTGRYGRYDEILGKGASKTVYRAFDEYEGIEVAWNQVKLCNFLQRPEDLERLYSEIHLLKTLKHKNIMKFYTSWVDSANRNLNFVTEMFTSGTLRQYRLKHKRVNIRAVKRWCRQILRGLLYLHSQDPPVIHRDLKCDNIFVNGNQGEIKIGDLGLAAILRKSHAAHCVGTPEFMAPEVYEEAYNELVDIYSFGMCVLEMVTFEYPYSECNHPVQIYKKVTSGKKPNALYKVKDPKMRQFVEKCLAPVSCRLSARELLSDPFLQIDDSERKSKLSQCGEDLDAVSSTLRQQFLEHEASNRHSIDCNLEASSEWRYRTAETEPSDIDLFEDHEDDELLENDENSIKGKIREDGGIVLRFRIADKEGQLRNIYFPFDTKNDTALTVATEMIAELDITDQDVIKIAEKIDGEIASLVPEWKPGPGIDEAPRISCDGVYQNDPSSHLSDDHVMDNMPNGAKNSQIFLNCSKNEVASIHHPMNSAMNESRALGSWSLQQSHSDKNYEKTDLSDDHLMDIMPNGAKNSQIFLNCSKSEVASMHYRMNSAMNESRALSSRSFRQSHSDRNYEKTDLSDDHSMGIMPNGAKNSQIFLNCSKSEVASMHYRMNSAMNESRALSSRSSRQSHSDRMFEKTDLSDDHFMDNMSNGAKNSQIFVNCSKNEVASMHYQMKSAPKESRAFSSWSFRRTHSNRDYEKTDQSVAARDDKEKIFAKRSLRSLLGSRSLSMVPSYCEDKFTSQIQWEIRWLWN